MTVSLCTIAYNEEAVIGQLLEQMKAQDYPKNRTELVLVDSGSTDKTKQILEEFREHNAGEYLAIRVLDNPDQNQAAGWNTAIRCARGDIIIRVDAHAEIPSDFVTQNVRLIESGEYVCGGARPNKINDPTPFKEMLFLAESSMFGSSFAGYRRKSEEEKKYVSSLFHGAYRREVFADVGGFNEDLGRTEDNELHYRIRQAGYSICQGSRIISYQHIRGTLGSMLAQKYGNGKWIGLTLGVCPKCLSIFHFVPLCFVLAVIGGTILSITGVMTGLPFLSLPLIVLAVLYASVDLLMTLTAVIPSPKHISQILLPVVFFLLHFVYGVGTLAGIVAMPFWKSRRDGSAQKKIEEVKKCVKENSKSYSEGTE